MRQSSSDNYISPPGLLGKGDFIYAAMRAKVNLTEYRKTGDYAHFIGVWTVGTMTELSSDEREAIERAFNAAPKGDHFYCIELRRYSGDDPRKIFAAYNGELGYTAMLRSEY